MAAEPPAAALQLGVLEPVQLVAEERSVTALRLALLRAVNWDVTGLDLSLGSTLTRGTFRGVQLSAANEVEGDCRGVQLGALVSYAEGELRGLQFSELGVRAGGGSGVQVAPMLAQATRFRGLQLALFTRAEHLEGLQIGLFNFNGNGFLPFFPLFNVGR